jgi:D-tyrosyl-tRNA(Tyr) deacylase
VVPCDPRAKHTRTSCTVERDRAGAESFGYDGWMKLGQTRAAAIYVTVCQPRGETVKQNHDGNQSMRAVVQRVSEARVTVAGRTVGEIGGGLCALVAVTREDDASDVAWMAAKLTGLRVFRNGEKHFDLSVAETGGGILLVSNFTVAADTKKGRRPSLDAAATPEQARELFEALVTAVKADGVPVATGEFGGDMRVALVNDGPATFILDSRG